MRVFKLPFLIIFFITSSSLIFSQKLELSSKDDYMKDLHILEQKSASRKMNFKRNLNTNNYDLKYHRLEWIVNPSVEYIEGTVTSYFEAKSDMNSITFDLQSNMTVGEVLQRGISLSYTQNSNDEVVITLPNTQATGVLDSLSIYYYGAPEITGFDAFQVSSHNGTPILGTLSEPYGAKTWWPCKQDLTDKIDAIDIFITHPSEYKAASNGLLISEEIGDTQTVTHWKHEYPIPAYLIAIAVTNYIVYNDDTTGSGFDFDIVNYVFPEDEEYARSNTAITPQIMSLFNDLFEMYPFADEKYGHAQFGWSGGMEHTTMSFMGGFPRGLIAHELAHQWFGDKITCGSWEDIWLNESFATYLTELVTENIDGDDAFKLWRRKLVDSSYSDWRCVTTEPNGSVFVNDTTNVGRIFSGRLSYRKGAMVLHMLRYKLGDLNFFQAIKNYLADPNLAYGYAITDNLIQHLETQSGEDLTEFFDDWFYGEGFPSFNLTYSQNDTGMLNIRVNQTQSDASVSFFETPLPIKVTDTNANTHMFRLEVTHNNQMISLPFGTTVSSIEIDPNYQIITTNNTAVAGIGTVALNSDVRVYPNPIKNDILAINTTGDVALEEVVIYNSLGQIAGMYKTNLNRITLSDFTDGVYTVKISTNHGIVFKKIVLA